MWKLNEPKQIHSQTDSQTNPQCKEGFTIQYVLIFGALMLAANILLGVLLVNQTRQTLRQLLEKNMLDITNTAAGLMDGDKLGALTEDDVDGPYFNQVIQTLSVFQDRVEIEFIYAVKQVGEKEFVFTVDPDPVDPGAFGEEVLFTYALGQAGKGIPTVDSAAAEDRWGNFYSAYSPVFDSGGAVAGIIGVDFDAEWYEQQLRGLSRTVTATTLLTVLIGAAVGWFNGTCLVKLQTNSFLLTMSTQIVMRGLVLFLVPFSLAKLDPFYTWLGRGRIGPLQVAVLALVLVLITGFAYTLSEDY